MFLLIVITVLSLALSFLCSMMEAALLTVPYHHVKHLADSGSKRAQKLLLYKDDIRQPIAAILLLNTISHTVGAAVGGGLVAQSFTQDYVVIFSIIFTLLLLYIAEIPPKELGVVYCRTLSLVFTPFLSFLIKVFYPFIVISEQLAKFVGHDSEEPSISIAEVLSLATIGSEEGVLDRLEGSVIKNIIGLDRRLVKDILTPRVVVFRLADDTKIGSIKEAILSWNHSRVPIFPQEEPDRVERYVLQKDVFRAIVRDQMDLTLKDISRPLTTVSDLIRADKLLLEIFEKREHICSVVDEHGGFAGIVTLEDIIEEIVGREILDESDLISDLRSYARSISNKRKR